MFNDNILKSINRKLARLTEPTVEVCQYTDMGWDGIYFNIRGKNPVEQWKGTLEIYHLTDGILNLVCRTPVYFKLV